MFSFAVVLRISLALGMFCCNSLPWGLIPGECCGFCAALELCHPLAVPCLTRDLGDWPASVQGGRWFSDFRFTEGTDFPGSWF